MKRALLIVLCLSTTIVSYAGFGIRLSGGLALAVPDNKQYIILDQKVKPNYAASFKVYYDVLKLEIGLGVDMMKLSTSLPNDWEAVYADPAIPVYAFVNKKHRFIKSDIDYGLTAGYMFSRTDGVKNHGDYSLPSNSGITAGLQLGGNINITKGFGINIEAGARYASLGYVPKPDPNFPGSPSNEKVRQNMFYFPVLLGFRFEM